MCGGGTQTTVSKTEIPPEVLARYNAVNARAEEAAKTPFQPYTGQFVAPLTETQQAGIQATNQYSQTAQPFFGAGAGLTMQGARSVGPLTQGQIAYYQNPYTQYVAGATEAALRQQQGQQLSQQQADAIRGGAFGGDRAGIQRAVLQGQQGLATAQALAPIYSQGYQQAVQTAQGQQGVVGQDLARQLQAGQQIAGLGTGAQAAALQGAQAQMQAGTLEQQTQQAQDTAQYQQFLQQRGYPFQVAQFLANIAMGTGALSGSTQTTTAPAPFFSDKRLKHDAEKVGEMHDGTPIYRFKYNGSDHTQIGLMAQDVEKRHPEAVGESQGYKTVDYKKATDEAAHKAYGGGIMPNSMGGAVYEPGHYAAGGIADTDLQALLAQQKQSFGPFGQGGLYGGSQHATPYSPQGGGTAGYVPAGNLHVPKLMTPSAAPAQKQTSTASELYQNLKSLDSIASDVTGKGLFQRGREATGLEGGKNTQNQTAPDVKPAPPVENDPQLGGLYAHGGLVPRHHYLGGGPVIPGAPEETDNPGSESGTQGDVLGKVVKEGAEQAPRQLQQPGQSAPAPQQGPNPLGLAASGISAAKGLGSIGSGISSLASGLGAGAEAAGAAAGAAGAAGGIGSALGSIGTGVAQVLPFLAMLSDERVKHNQRVVGKLYDGQPVYSFDYGDGRTQIGLMAQNVERKHPEAVAETEGGLKMVDYHRATEKAADKGHFEQGGLVPRGHYQEGGPTEEITTPEQAAAAAHPADSIFEKRVIPQESGGKHFDKSGRPLTSSAGAIGIAQVMPKTAPEAAKLAGLDYDENRYRNDPEYNKALGQAYFRAQYNRYNDPTMAMAAYNAGPGRVDSAIARSRETGGDWRSFLPAETQKYIGMTPAGGGGFSGAMKSVTAPIAEAAKDTGNFFSRNKDIILPVLQGLGAMAGSKSRYLGSAILEGLGAGAKSYADLEQQTAATTGQQAANLQTMQNLAFNSIKNVGTADRPIYMAMLKDGQMVPLQEWMEKGGELIGGAPGANYAKFLAKNVQTQAQGRGIEDVGATGQGPGAQKQPPISPPAPPPAPIAGFKVPEESWNTAKAQEFKDTMGMGAPEAAKTSKDYSATVNALGQAANASKPQTNEMVNIVSDLYHGNALDKGGANAGIIAAWQGRLNDIADRSGLGRNFFGNITTSADALEKLNTVSAQLRTTAAGQAAYNALAKNIEALPGIDKDPKSNLINTSMIMVDRQRQEDQWRHAQAYGRVTGNLYNRAYDHFVSGKDPSDYSKEANVIEKFLAETNPVHVKLMTTGRVTPEQIEEFFVKKYNMPGMSRYFVR